MRRLLIALTLALLASSSFADGKIYKWTDKDGTVHYGSAPPVNEKAATRVKVQTSPTVAANSPSPTTTTKSGEKPSGPLTQQFEENCAIAQRSLTALEGTGDVVTKNADGTTGTPLDGEQRAARLKSAAEQVSVYCK